MWLSDALQEHHKTATNPKSLLTTFTQLRANAKGKTPLINNSNAVESSSAGRDYQLILPSDATRKIKHKSRQSVYDKG